MGLRSLDELEEKVVPKKIRGKGEELANLPDEVLSEADALSEITQIAKMNKVLKSFIGMGYVSTGAPIRQLLNTFTDLWLYSMEQRHPQSSCATC